MSISSIYTTFHLSVQGIFFSCILEFGDKFGYIFFCYLPYCPFSWSPFHAFDKSPFPPLIRQLVFWKLESIRCTHQKANQLFISWKNLLPLVRAKIFVFRRENAIGIQCVRTGAWQMRNGSGWVLTYTDRGEKSRTSTRACEKPGRISNIIGRRRLLHV